MNAPAKSFVYDPFDAERLDELMDEAGIDVLVATSKHNVQYLLGGHRAFFFDYMDAMGISRYLPVLVYAKGAPDKAAYFGHRMESYQKRGQSVLDAGGARPTRPARSTPCRRRSTTCASAGMKTKRHRRRDVVPAGRCRQALQSAFPDSEMKDALFVLERLRSLKTPDELEDAARSPPRR